MAEIFESFKEKILNSPGRLLEVGSHRFTKVYAMDEPGPGGACHEYVIAWDQKQPPGITGIMIAFQKGSLQENEVNGCFMEDLITICIDRLEAFQAGDFQCVENAMALDSLKSALRSLDTRTNDRQDREVEGYMEP
jgi:hypothetical protein